jgi:hypothetical protein
VIATRLSFLYFTFLISCRRGPREPLQDNPDGVNRINPFPQIRTDRNHTTPHLPRGHRAGCPIGPPLACIAANGASLAGDTPRPRLV